jgi:hypothetical protein
VALVRVYCGVATAEMAPWLTVAVVDDSGRLLDMRHISDDPAGYAYLGALLADRSGGIAPVALDRPEHLVAQLLAAANTPIAICDEASLVDFADRFSDDTSYEEMQAPASQRCAIGLARALQAGALYATAQTPSWNLDEVKPVLAAHAAVTAGRQAAAAALREVLRELYPAALRAYPDPAEFIPLRILEELPEPGLLSPSPSNRNRDSALVASLASNGVTDTTTAVNAITALRVAVEESPRWHANRAIAPVVAETVRQAVVAVRACDAASAALVGALVERLGALSGAAAQPYLAAAAPVSPAIPRRLPGPAAEVPASRLAPRASAASAAASGVPAAGFIPNPRAEPGYQGGRPDWLAEPAFAAPGRSDWSDPAFDPAAGRPDWAADAGFAPVPTRQDWPADPRLSDDFAAVYASLPAAAHTTGENRQVDEGYSDASTLSFSMDPLNAPLHPAPQSAPPARPEGGPLRLVDPPGRFAEPEPRYAESAYAVPQHARPQYAGPQHAGPQYAGAQHAGAQHAGAQSAGAQYAGAQYADPLTDPYPGGRPQQPVLRVIDGGRQSEPPRRPEDTDLLIFSQTQSNSAWFVMADENVVPDEPPHWGRLADDGWRAAEQLSHPSVGADTRAGLPKRVPQANLVPGSAQPPQRQLRIVRDAQSIAAHTSGYFRGWKRGQEIGGFAVGQRDRAAWEFNREQRAREGADQRARLS